MDFASVRHRIALAFAAIVQRIDYSKKIRRAARREDMASRSAEEEAARGWRRLALPIMVGLVAIAGLVLFQLAAGPLRMAGEDGTRAALSPPEARAGPIERIDARSGAVDYALLDRRLRLLMADPQMTGLAVAVIENGELVFVRGYGETLRGSGEAVTPETVFRWASLSKGVAATMLALMADEGRVDLNAPVGRYSPSLKLPNGGQVHASVIDLLSHRLGITRNAFDRRLEADESPFMLRLAMSQLEPACAPGQCYRYQNVAFDAASEIVEELSPGKSYEAAVSEKLLRPLGMYTASVSMRGLKRSESWAHSHNRGGTEIEVVEPYYRVPAAGGMNGSILDLALWMQAQMGDAPDVIPPGIVALLHRPQIRTAAEDRRNRRYDGRLTDSHYALGWRVMNYAGHRVVGHRGAIRGYRAMILFDPASRAGVAILSNSDSSRPFNIPIDIFDRLYGLPDADWIGYGAPVIPLEKIAESRAAQGSAQNTTAGR